MSSHQSIYDDLKDSTLFKLYLATHSNKSTLQKVCHAWMPWSVTIYLACQDLTKSYINSKGGMTWFIVTLNEKYDRVHHPLIQAYLLLLLLVSYSFKLHRALKSRKSATLHGVKKFLNLLKLTFLKICIGKGKKGKKCGRKVGKKEI